MTLTESSTKFQYQLLGKSDHLSRNVELNGNGLEQAKQQIRHGAKVASFKLARSQTAR